MQSAAEAGSRIARWFQSGGWVATAVLIGGLLLAAAVPATAPARSALVLDSLGMLLAAGSVLLWWWAWRSLRGGGIRRSHVGLALAAAGAGLLGPITFLYVHLAGLQGLPDWLPWWFRALGWGQILFWSSALLFWPPMSRAAETRAFLVIDVAILTVTASLLFWYFQLRIAPDGADLVWQAHGAAVVWVVALIGVSVAVLRGSVRPFEAAHRLVAASLVVTFVANFGLNILLRLIDPGLVGPVMASLTVVTGGLQIMGAEALRRRWPWPGRPTGPASASLAPVLAVAAVGILVLTLAVRHIDSGLGAVLIGGVAVTLLLLARQFLTMRQNTRLLAEQAAHETNARIAALVRHTSDVIVVTDERFRIRFASPSAESLWAERALDLLDTDIRELVDLVDREEAARQLADAAQRPGQSTVVRWRMPGTDGEPRRVETVITSLLHEPSVNGIVLTLRDQTERAELEEQLQQAQKMEAVGQLAGGIAHDFNNLLTTILGHSELGMEVVEDGAPVRDDLRQIERAAQLAASLTNQLLAFSRKQVMEPRIVEVSESLRQVTGLMRRLIEERIRTELVVEPEVGAVRMDPSQMEQIILNLGVNARDAMPEGGTLTVAARRERISTPLTGAIPVPPGDFVVIDVTDTGVGMDPATQARVFEPFFTTKPPGRGTGLGLASVYGVVKQNGGGLRLRSIPGAGTTFSVYLPRVPCGAEPMEGPVAGPPTETDSATILLVEDEPWLREIAERVLRREGYRVLAAGDAVEARALAATVGRAVDLLLTDVVMPGVSGPRLAAQMRQVQPGLRVLYMSGYAGSEANRELGADERLLEKPFSPVVLVEAVRAVLAGGSIAPRSRR